MSQNVDQLKQSVADQDVLCPGCNYNLRGLAGERCPECGESARRILVPPWWRLTRAERWTALGAGFALFGIFGLAWVVWRESKKDPLNILAMWLPGAMLAAWIVAVGVWSGFRHAARGRNWVSNLFVAGFMAFGLCSFLLLLFALVATA